MATKTPIVLQQTAAVVLAAVLLVSCAGSNPGSFVDTPQVAQPAITALPVSSGPSAFPEFPGNEDYPVSIMRSAADADIVVEGNEFVEEEGENNGPGDSGPSTYIIAPGDEDDLAWAVFGVGGFDADRPVSIEIDINSATILPGGDDPLPLSSWIGLSNYTNFSWEWYGPYEDPVSLLLNSATLHDRYVSTANSFYYTIVTDSSSVEPSPGNPAGLTAVEIISSTTGALDAESTDYNPTNPHYPTTSGAGLGGGKQGLALDPPTQFVTIDWDHLTDSASPDNEASHYDVYRRRVGGAGGTALLGTATAPDTDFVDPTDKRALIDEVIPGETYSYMVVARNSAGSTPFAHAGTQTIPLLPPPNMTAIHRPGNNWIELNWNPVEGATSYQVYRDNPTAPYVHLGNVTTWRDETLGGPPPDYGEHTYWVRGVNQFVHGGSLSDPAVARINIPPVAMINVEGGQTGPPPHVVVFNGGASTDEFAPISMYEWDADGDTLFEFSSDADPTYPYTFNTSGIYVVKLRVTDSAGATNETTVDINVNLAPVAELIGPAPPVYNTQPIPLDAAGSFDTDGTIQNFEWDLDEDGMYSNTPFEQGFDGQAFIQHPALPVGSYAFSIRVTDDDGATSSDSVDVIVSP